jgi:hypothetical protein
MDVKHLESVAQQLACRVRDDDPVANQRWLHAMLPDPADREALLYVLAAAVPINRSWAALTAWATTDIRREARRRSWRAYQRRKRAADAA